MFAEIQKLNAPAKKMVPVRKSKALTDKNLPPVNTNSVEKAVLVSEAAKNKGKWWSQVEDDRLKLGYSIHGKNYEKLMTFVDGRTVRGVIDRIRKFDKDGFQTQHAEGSSRAEELLKAEILSLKDEILSLKDEILILKNKVKGKAGQDWVQTQNNGAEGSSTADGELISKLKANHKIEIDMLKLEHHSEILSLKDEILILKKEAKGKAGQDWVQNTVDAIVNKQMKKAIVWVQNEFEGLKQEIKLQ
ncbi:hypothetical protein L195_g049284 [Trifolium pratense]|uniref:Uncharacterized protein n=1 Tax=Trifolium pratense TaxID=57577 RepID=A0A2K3JNN9_TRIPR|nr:hypothetical protein L195_g049284 [Trifolium pratense]